MSDVVITPIKGMEGEITVPPDKSISHRALILGALSEGELTIRNLLIAQDPLSTWSCLSSLGVAIEKRGEEVILRGVGMHGFKKSLNPLDCGNSGATMRILTGLLAGQSFVSTLIGDDSLQKRPMDRVIEPLLRMGAKIDGEFPPLHIQGGSLQGIQYFLPIPSAQVKSALLIAGLLAEGETILHEPVPSRDHTERVLQEFGADIEKKKGMIRISGKNALTPKPIDIPGDFSSAMAFIVATLITPNSSLILRDVGMNPSRTGALHILKSMGGKIRVLQKIDGIEPRADLQVESSPLRGVEIGGSILQSLIDEIPLLAIAATQAEGVTLIKDAGELRIKESDRLGTIAEGLSLLGAKVGETPDGLLIVGPTLLHGARCRTHGDHRMVMAFSVAGLVAKGETTVEKAEAVEISYPEFFQHLRSVTRIV